MRRKCRPCSCRTSSRSPLKAVSSASASGLAASAVGFVLLNQVLIVAGALVGASGVVLTQIMCKVMHRSPLSIVAGDFGTGDRPAGAEGASESARPVRAIDPEEGAMILAYAHSVVIVPGYGMAAARAQHAVHELAEELERRGIDVKYAIHPVAGRMPGHMNVLLAEARGLRQTKPLATWVTMTAVKQAVVAWRYSSGDGVCPQDHPPCHKTYKYPVMAATASIGPRNR